MSGENNGQAMLGEFSSAWLSPYLQTDSKICGWKGFRSAKSVHSLNKGAIAHDIIYCKEEKRAEITNTAKYKLWKLGCFA